MVFDGDFEAPAIARLRGSDAKLAEMLLLNGGNLKQLADDMGITYPTLRKRLDQLIDTINKMKQADEKRIEEILNGIENQTVPPKEGIRRIKELKGEQ